MGIHATGLFRPGQAGSFRLGQDERILTNLSTALDRNEEEIRNPSGFLRNETNNGDGLPPTWRIETRKETLLAALFKCSRPALNFGSPALSVIRGRQPPQRLSFSRGFLVVPDRRRAVFIGIAGEPEFLLGLIVRGRLL